VDRKVVIPAARGKEGLLSDGAWKSVKALMMKISPGTDRSGDVLHSSGVRFSSLKAKKEVWQAVQFVRGKVVFPQTAPTVDVWNLHLHGNDRSFASSYQQLHSQPRIDVAGKSVDDLPSSRGMEDLQKNNSWSELAPVWGRPKGLRCLCQY
jgi:hypothetical protein